MKVSDNEYEHTRKNYSTGPCPHFFKRKKSGWFSATERGCCSCENGSPVVKPETAALWAPFLLHALGGFISEHWVRGCGKIFILIHIFRSRYPTGILLPLTAVTVIVMVMWVMQRGSDKYLWRLHEKTGRSQGRKKVKCSTSSPMSLSQKRYFYNYFAPKKTLSLISVWTSSFPHLLNKEKLNSYSQMAPYKLFGCGWENIFQKLVFSEIAPRAKKCESRAHWPKPFRYPISFWLEHRHKCPFYY